MKSRIKWMGMLMVVIATVSSAQAAVVDLVGNGTDIGGFHHFSDTNNWAGGNLPTSTDVPRFRYNDNDRNKLYLDASPSVATIVVLDGIQANIGGPGTMTASSYLNMAYTDPSLDLWDSATVNIGNRIRTTTGTTAITLHNDSTLETQNISFDAAGAKLLVTLNNNSMYKQLGAPQLAANMHADSQFVLNDSSSVLMENMTASELFDSWFSNGAVFHLNDDASITLQTSGNNIDDIATYHAAGYLVLNGKTDAVKDVDYTYNVDTGVLQVIPEPATLGLFMVGTVGVLAVRHRLMDRK
ncbi:PEP-CTERM sorting domain-containing protein [Tichowtungia aerotolerans]|uniref:PEP-CTERM sorting domain-containing protein n=1 Tax=Tichowtungia aerotolerans TaxID=2697043 RepID=A0A6P1M7J6_9BACT|nr:PEP-CTERM sorting domain-containing protein [Tichowtungia aerotolerans]QHI69837.1 PEP-CTERM sorting domain-containing protein [Tichowtungia aerotolerans]